MADADRERALGLMDVSRETAERLDALADLLRRWQAVKNLVGPATLTEVWSRHIADSWQLVPLAPEAATWADMGAGAGFPGLVIAVAITGRPGGHVHLIESNNRKAAFLREAARTTGAPVTVHPHRAEDVLPTLGAIDILTARALAPLPQLLLWGKGLMAAGTVGLFPKGEEFARESATVMADPAYRVTLIPSRTRAEGRIVRVSMADR